MKSTGKSEREVIEIACATDGEYAPYLSAMLESLADNLSEQAAAAVTVMHCGLPEGTAEALEASSRASLAVRCVDVSRLLAPYRDYTYAASYISELMYCRALIPEVLSEARRAIYLDCDLAVLGDISELYFTDMQGHAVLGAKNPMHPKMRAYAESLGLDPSGYINSGVLLLDCEALRAEGFTEKFFEILSRHTDLRFPDQDVLNLLLAGKIGYLEPEWNYLWHLERLGHAQHAELRMPPPELAAYTAVYSRAKVVHYTGDLKPWVADAVTGAEHFWRYAERCPMREEIAVRRREALRPREKIKLVFLDFEGGAIRLTCAHVLPAALSPRDLSYCINGDERAPDIYFERSLVSGGIAMVWRMFKAELPMPTRESPTELSFRFGSHKLLFEYEKFFPLNGLPESYFADRGVILYRDGRVLKAEPCSLRRRLLFELKYLRALLSDGKKGKKHALLRAAYPLLWRLLPKRAWLISDRPEVAGDNGEALFLHLTAHPPKGVTPYFVIRRRTEDLRRLKRRGRVVAAGSVGHKLLSLVAEVKAVSQTDAELYSPIEARHFKDILAKQRRVFLQHGITKDDISSAYSRYAHGFDLFITAAYPEYFSIIENPSYGLEPSRVALVGFPRHDMLIGKRERLILVCPTWRSYLLPCGKASPELFASSFYFSAWHSLLSDGALPDIAARHGYRIVFLPHRNTLPYLSLFDGISPDVQIARGGYSELISRAALMVTDFSSVAFDMGYLGRPVVYYTFDREDFFAKHTCREGYFDAERDGFGEVAHTEREALDAVERALKTNCVLPADKAERSESFFAYRGGNSARVTEAILRLTDGR